MKQIFYLLFKTAQSGGFQLFVSGFFLRNGQIHDSKKKILKFKLNKII